MRLNQHDSVLIYKELNALAQRHDLSPVYSLSQRERRVIQTALTNIRTASFKTNELSDVSVRSLIDKLHQERPVRPKFFIRLWRALAGFLGFRISTKQVHKLFQSTQADCSRYIRDLRLLPSRVESLQKEISDLDNLKHFKIRRAGPEYQKLSSFYESLLNHIENSRELLADRITAVKNQIQLAKAQGDDKDFIYILEKEILVSLSKLYRYNGASFTKELQISAQAFQRAATCCQDCLLEENAITKLRAQLCQMEQGLNKAHYVMRSIHHFEDFTKAKTELVSELEKLPNYLLQHNVLTYLEEGYLKKGQKVALEKPLSTILGVESNPQKAMDEWIGALKKARETLWDEQIAKERGFFEPSSQQDYARSIFVHQVYEQDLHMPFCHPMSFVAESAYVIAFNQLLAELPLALSDVLQKDLAFSSLLEDLKNAELEKARLELKNIIDHAGLEIRSLNLLNSFDEKMALAQVEHLEAEKKMNMGLNLLNLGRCLVYEENTGSQIPVWRNQIQDIEDLKARGIVSLTHFKVLGQMLSLAMQELEKELPNYSFKTEKDLLKLGISDHQTLCDFLVKQRLALSQQLRELFEAVLGQAI